MYTPMYSMYGENFKFCAYTTEFVAVWKKSTMNAQNHAKHRNYIHFQKTAQNFLPKYNKFKRFDISDRKNY